MIVAERLEFGFGSAFQADGFWVERFGFDHFAEAAEDATGIADIVSESRAVIVVTASVTLDGDRRGVEFECHCVPFVAMGDSPNWLEMVTIKNWAGPILGRVMESWVPGRLVMIWYDPLT